MSVRRAIFDQVAKPVFVKNVGTEVVGIESGRLLSRLLFFDEVVIDSIRLREIPFLAKMFGAQGLKQLLKSGVLRLATDKCFVITGVSRNGVPHTPLLQFDEGIAHLEDNEQNLERNLGCLLQITGLSNSQRQELGDVIRANLSKLSPSYGDELLKQVRKDLTTNKQLLRNVLKRKIPDLDINQIELEIYDLGGMQKFETNLQSRLGISVEEEHQILTQVIGGVANINQRIANMAEYQAISQFEDSEAPLLFGKVHSIVSSINPQQDEEAFLRVIEVTGLPRLIADRRIDVDKLMKIRETAECREFRSWLSTTDSIDDAKLKEIISGLRAKAASFIASGGGKTIRLAVNTGLGLIPGYGTALALGEGIVDSFLLDKMLPSSGVLSFLNNSVPSVFSTS